MDQFVEGKNPYTILGLENGQQSTVDEIKKAYRRLALVKHPDKAKTPNAAQEFDELKKAYAVLSDKAARAALDEYLDAQKAREERLSKQDAKRQRMREELERKEKAGARAKNEEELARAKLKEELNALRMRAQREQQERQQAANAAAAARRDTEASASGRQTDAVPDDQDETTQLLMRTVKVTWDPTIGDYPTSKLRQIFSAQWTVEDVIFKDSKKKKKASALVVLSSISEAQHAAQEVHGDLKNPLLVTPYLKVMPGPEQQQQQQQQGTGASTAAGQSGAAGQQPLFASGSAGATSRPVQRPSKPLFPGAAPREPKIIAPETAAAAAAAAASAGERGGAFSSFPAMPTQGPGAGSGFSSFPGMPSAASTAATGGSSKPSSFPSMLPGAAAAAGRPGKFSSFPSSFPTGTPAGAASRQANSNGVPVGGAFEDAVLQKLQQTSANLSKQRAT